MEELRPRLFRFAGAVIMQQILSKRTMVCATGVNRTPNPNSARSHLCQPDPARGIFGRVGLTLLGTVLLSQLASAVPSFDPFADATANGGTSYAVGGTLTNQFNPALFTPWYSRG